MLIFGFFTLGIAVFVAFGYDEVAGVDLQGIGGVQSAKLLRSSTSIDAALALEPGNDEELQRHSLLEKAQPRSS
jgi:hypothetical protein